MNLPAGFEFTHGTSIHTSADPCSHLTGSLNGETVHIPYKGQTTLGMFERSLGGHTFEEVNDLHERFPAAFRQSGF